MQFLTIKTRGRERKDGREWAQAMVVRKTQKAGKVLSEKSISVKRPVLVTGAHGSGKSYWLSRLYKEAARVWATRAKATPIYLSTSDALAEWVHGKHFELWWAGRDDPDETRHWSKLKPHEKYKALPLYLSETGAVLFIDDAHTLTTNSRKGRLAQECVRAAHVWVIAASDENRVFPGLRKDITGTDPQIFRLDTDVAYDYTPYLSWLMMAVFVMAGFPEGAMALGALKLLSNGKKATKQA